MRREGRLIVNGGQFVLELRETKQRPDSIRTEISMQGLSQVQAYDGKEGWRIDPFGGRKDPERMPADDVKEYAEDATIDGVLADAAPPAAASSTAPRTSTARLRTSLSAQGRQPAVRLPRSGLLEIRVESQRVVRGVKRTRSLTTATTKRSAACSGRFDHPASYAATRPDTSRRS
jgi:hypothetical protein